MRHLSLVPDTVVDATAPTATRLAATHHATGEPTTVYLHDDQAVPQEPSREAVSLVEQQLERGLPVVYVDSGSVIGKWRPWAMDDLRNRFANPNLLVVDDLDITDRIPNGDTARWTGERGSYMRAGCDVPTLTNVQAALTLHDGTHRNALVVFDHFDHARPWSSLRPDRYTPSRLDGLRLRHDQVESWRAETIRKFAEARPDAATAVIKATVEPEPEPEPEPLPSRASSYESVPSTFGPANLASLDGIDVLEPLPVGRAVESFILRGDGLDPQLEQLLHNHLDRGHSIVWVACGGVDSFGAIPFDGLASDPRVLLIDDVDATWRRPTGPTEYWNPTAGPWKTAPCQLPTLSRLNDPSVTEHERRHGPVVVVLANIGGARPWGLHSRLLDDLTFGQWADWQEHDLTDYARNHPNRRLLALHHSSF